MKKFLFFSIGAIILICLLSTLLPEGPQNLPSTHVQVHQILSERLTPENCTPIGGAAVCSAAHWFWGFPDGFLLPDNPTWMTFPVKIDVEGIPVMVKGGIYYPSHLILEGEIDSAKSNLAYNPLKYRFPQPITSFPHAGNEWGPIDGCPSVATSWRSAGSANSPAWYGVDLGEPKMVLSAVLQFLESGSEQLPLKYFLEYEDNGKWLKIPGQHYYPVNPGSGQNLVRFPRLNAQKIRVVLHGGGLVNFQLQGAGTRLPLVTEEKFITEDDVLFSRYTFQNLSWHFPLNVHFSGLIPWGQAQAGNFVEGELNGRQIVLALKNALPAGDSSELIEFDLSLKPREKREVRIVIATAQSRTQAQAKVSQWLSQNLPIEKQVRHFNSWFARNIPFFFSSHTCLNQAYYRHWNRIRQQLLQVPGIFFPFAQTGSENPDTTINLVNQFVGDVRWLRDPAVAQNFILNLLPTTTAGTPSNADDFWVFLISGIWKLNQVHPDRDFLAAQSAVFETLIRQLAEKYDSNQNHLLEILEDVGIAGFSPEMNLPVRRIESVGLNAEYFQACAAIDSCHLFCESPNANRTGFSQKIRQALPERTWHDYFLPVDAETGTPILVFGPTGLKPFIYDIASARHLSAWDVVLPKIRERLRVESGNLPPILLQAMLRTWQRFPDGPVSQSDLVQAFDRYFCDTFIPTSGSDGTFSASKHLDPARPGIDYIINGIAGIIPQANPDQLLLNPALPEQYLAFFVLENLHYHGHKLTIIWDRPDARDHFEDNRAGFDIYVNGRLAGSSLRLEQLRVRL